MSLGFTWRVAILGLACNAACCGCRSLSSRGPVSQSVAMSRQLTQQGANAMERGDWKRAESLLQRAVDTEKNDADARRHYAEALWHRGARNEAIAQFEQARKLAPEDPPLAVRTGAAYLAQGEVERAAVLADDALRLDAKCGAAWALHGQVAAARGQHRAALADYQRALGYLPDDYDVTLLVAETYRQLNEPRQALVALQALADAYPPEEQPQQVLQLQGLAFQALGRYDEAARSLRAAVAGDRPTSDLLCQLAAAELLAGRAAHARYALDQALALDPQHAASRALTARLATAPQPVVR